MNKIYFLLFIGILSFSNSYAQKKANIRTVDNSRLREKTVSDKITTTPTSNTVVKSQPSEKIDADKVINSADDSKKEYGSHKVALRMSEVQPKNSVSFKIDNNLSHLDNLLILIEEKENTLKSSNKSLVSSKNYSSLLKTIEQEKFLFNDHVNNIGFENCSLKEQNYFLAFLKEENKLTEYQKYSSKLK